VQRTDDTCMQSFFFTEIEGMEPLGITSHRWDDNIKMDL
jgi:hypothetical protein